MSLLARLFRRDAVAQAAPDTSGGHPLELSAAEFLARRTPDAQLVDVRTPAEFHGGHLKGAWNADVTDPDFPATVDGLGLDPTRPVYLYCRSGNRSGRATRILRERGYSRAVNVGGVADLVREGAALE